MEDIQCMIELLAKRRSFDRYRSERAKIEQTEEYDNLMKTIQSLKDDRMQCKENILKNLNTLIAHKHMMHKIIYDSNNITGLPITYGCQHQAIKLFSDMVEFINDIDHVYETLDKKNDIDSEKINQDILSCINSVGTELSKAKSAIIELETLKRDIRILQEREFEPNNDDIEFNGSLF